MPIEPMKVFLKTPEECRVSLVFVCGSLGFCLLFVFLVCLECVKLSFCRDATLGGIKILFSNHRRQVRAWISFSLRLWLQHFLSDCEDLDQICIIIVIKVKMCSKSPSQLTLKMQSGFVTLSGMFLYFRMLYSCYTTS